MKFCPQKQNAEYGGHSLSSLDGITCRRTLPMSPKKTRRLKKGIKYYANNTLPGVHCSATVST